MGVTSSCEIPHGLLEGGKVQDKVSPCGSLSVGLWGPLRGTLWGSLPLPLPLPLTLPLTLAPGPGPDPDPEPDPDPDPDPVLPLREPERGSPRRSHAGWADPRPSFFPVFPSLFRT